jgi:dTDP-4-amino-4,6-dideoxygalactose transaminase
VPPAGSRIPLRPLLGGSSREPASRLRDGLQRISGAAGVRLCRSGREALRVALGELAERSGRNEVVVPAYTCFTVPSAVVAAGLRVRLVDVDQRGWIDRKAISRLPLDRAAALIVCNLFGVAEPVADLLHVARATGVAVVDDAAQALGARGADGLAGGRGDLGIASFGRGKPLQGLGGGAILERVAGGAETAPRSGLTAPLRALVRAAAFDLSLRPRVFAVLAALPGLGIGRSHFDPAFQRGGIDAAALRIAARELGRFERQRVERSKRARALGECVARETPFRPLLAPTGGEGAYPRLAMLARDAEARDRALAQLAAIGAGASPLYPTSLDGIKALEPHLAERVRCPGAQQLAERLLTLPTQGALEGERLERTVAALAADRAPAAGLGPARNRTA